MSNMRLRSRQVAALSVAVLSACNVPYSAPILYQAQTPDCRNWADGSSFGLPRDISVVAGAPEQASDGSLRLRLAYFIPRGESVAFTEQDFAIVEPGGSASVKGTVEAAERLVINVPRAKSEGIPALPQTLTALDQGDKTMIQATLRFPAPPKRFDLAHPRMLVEGKAYPVRTYTYRWFEDRQRFGLCT